MKEKPNPIFEINYRNYLQKVNDVDLSQCASVLDITVDEEKRTAEIPFFKTIYRVSQFGVVDEGGKRPDYGICVVLLKYLLMCPQHVPPENDWVTSRDFSDSGQTQDAGLSEYTTSVISKRYSGSLSRLKTAVKAIGGKSPKTEYPYDLSAILTALPRLPILFLFNDADEQFPAQSSILYERRAERFLDAECRVMAGWYLLEHLKKAEH